MICESLSVRMPWRSHASTSRMLLLLATAGRRMGRWILALAAAAIGTAAAAQDVPQVISPLRVESDHNGVNMASGRTQIGLPVLSVPAAPNLRFDRVQNAAPGSAAHLIASSAADV